MPVTGSCHCGKIAYALEGDPPTEAMACNCSICRRRGSLLHFAPAEKFTLNGSGDHTIDYTFNKHVIHHRFCGTCGCAPFAEGVGSDGVPMIAINLRCADDIDLEALTINRIDGANM